MPLLHNLMLLNIEVIYVNICQMIIDIDRSLLIVYELPATRWLCMIANVKWILMDVLKCLACMCVQLKCIVWHANLLIQLSYWHIGR